MPVDTQERRSVGRKPMSMASRDQDAIRHLIELHACPDPRIIDVTANEGRFWRGLPQYKPFRVDVNPALYAAGKTDMVGDFRCLDGIADHTYDVVVCDPPHVTDAGGTGVMGKDGWGQTFGLGTDELRGASVSGLFLPFLQEAQRILVPEHGIALVKIADMIHNSRYQWQHVELIQAARSVGLTPCDMNLVFVASRAGLVDPRWIHVQHVRQVHVYWIVIRNGDSCVSAYAPRVEHPSTLPMFAGLPTEGDA